MRGDGAANGFDLCEGAIDGGLAGDGTGIQMEKKMASRPPSRIRGMSTLPSVWRAAKSKFGSSKALRGVVVRIDDDGFRVQGLSLRGDAGGLVRECQG